MARQSARLLASGYYERDDISNLSCLANVSYHEKPVKVFKKREGNRSKKSPKADCATKPISYEPPIPAAQSNVNPPALVSYDTMQLNSRYLWAEGKPIRPTIRPPIVNTCSSRITNSPSIMSSAQSSGYMSKISSAYFSLMVSLLLMAATVKSRIMHLGAFVNNSVSSQTKKACGLLLLLVLIFLCVWLLFPLLTPFVSNTSFKQTESRPLIPDMTLQPNTIPHAAVELSPLAPVNDPLTPELQQAMEKWLSHYIKEHDVFRFDEKGSRPPMADKMADFALKTQGARVIASRSSKSYHGSRSPLTVIEGHTPLHAGNCWAFPGAQGTLAISLSHPVRIKHVTVDHLPRCNSPTGKINSAPKDFKVYGMKDTLDNLTLLGAFTYKDNGESTQTFQLPNPTDDLYHSLEMHVLSNWGQAEYTCLYRFRVHGEIDST
nr:PREDICTED: SUN domain-containing protein 1-like [Paralichthys olivaceus]